jgi:hypothetical protein
LHATIRCQSRKGIDTHIVQPTSLEINGDNARTRRTNKAVKLTANKRKALIPIIVEGGRYKTKHRKQRKYKN